MNEKIGKIEIILDKFIKQLELELGRNLIPDEASLVKAMYWFSKGVKLKETRTTAKEAVTHTDVKHPCTRHCVRQGAKTYRLDVPVEPEKGCGAGVFANLAKYEHYARRCEVRRFNKRIKKL